MIEKKDSETEAPAIRSQACSRLAVYDFTGHDNLGTCTRIYVPIALKVTH